MNHKCSSFHRFFIVLGALSCFTLPPLFAAINMDDMDPGLEKKSDEEEVATMLGEEVKKDFDLLQATHLSLLTGWNHVQHGAPVAGATNAPCHWREANDWVTPLDNGEISTLIDVPQTGTYRISLRQMLNPRAPTPVTLALTPQKAGSDKTSYLDAGTSAKHVYGQTVLNNNTTGKQLEKAFPLRFESEVQLISTLTDATPVWEYWDVELQKGVYRAALGGADKQVMAHALLLTRSKDFRPSFASTAQDKTLGRIFMRFRTPATNAVGQKLSVQASLGYHWRGRRGPGGSQDVWGWNIGSAPLPSSGTWSPFIDATDAIIPGPGPWSTCNIAVAGLQNGEVEIQFAWFPNEQATVLTLKTGIGSGAGMLRVPHGMWSRPHSSGVPAWGMWNQAQLNQVMTQESIIERYFTWAQQAGERLGLKPDHPRPNHIRLITGCGVSPANRERAAEMLAKLGVNWLEGAPANIIQKYKLHDELSAFNAADAAGIAKGMSEANRNRLTKVKVGDEIGTYTEPPVVNSDVAKRTAFHKFLTEQAKLEGLDMPAFLGVQDVDDLDCIGELSANPSRYERRLFYHSQRFCHLTTCDAYASITRGFEKYFPNVNVYNNYSPHPVFLTGATMNGSDWFVLPRNKAQTLGWAEDWGYYNGWDLGTQYQCTSFYAALIDCAVRKYGYRSGFYVGSNCGGSAVKMFNCVAEGISWLHLYDWGPIDSWAEGNNAWSENESEYYAVMCAAYAIGPADEIIGKGKREPRRTALLYNRSHEIVNGGTGRLNLDWMWTFFALKSSQIPVDVIIEEDLTPDELKRYDVVILGGFNLAKYHLATLKRWVEAGGLLIGTGGAAQYDIYNDPMPDTVDLFGARQQLSGADKTGSVAKVSFPSSAWFPQAEFVPAGMKFLLEPTTGKSLATYAGGECAAVVNSLGKGQAILLGFHPGATFQWNGSRTGPVRAWLASPLLKQLGRQRVEFDDPSSEATLFEHDSGLAVMLTSIAFLSPKDGSHLSVKTDRPIKEVSSALRGPLEWKRVGDRIEVKTLHLDPVDVIIFK